MDPERLDSEETADLLDECVALPLAERTAFLDRRCAGRERLRREVESLLSFLPDPEPDDDDESARAMRRVGLEIGGCRLLELIAIGGMGAVYRAEQQSPRREVAVKVLRPDGLGTDAWRRMKREAIALGRLDHPAIARVFTAGIHRDGFGATPFLTMELIDGGRPIHEWWRSTGLSPAAKLDRFATICEAIHHGHMKGVLHRDVKPGNLLVGRDDRPKVIDFGIARMLEPDTDSGTAPVTAGRVIGTIAYMAPERLEGSSVADVRSDVYGLGVVLYELLTGRLPYGRPSGSLAATATAISRGAAPPPSTFDRRCRGDLDVIVAMAMAVNPAARYDSASALAADLRAHLADEPIRARGVGRLARCRKFLSRNRVAVAGSAGVFLALVIGLAWSLRAAARAERALHLALLAQGDLMAARQDVSGAWRVLRSLEPARRDEWPAQVLERFALDAIDSANFGEWNLFRGRLDAGRRRMLASGWGERPELVVLQGSPAAVAGRIPLPSVGMGADWGRPREDGAATAIAGLADGRVIEVRANDGSELRVLTRFESDAAGRDSGPVSDVALSPDGRRLAVGHSSDAVRIVDLAEGTARDLRGFADPAAPNWVFVDWSPDGAALAVAATGGTFLVDAIRGEARRLSRRGANQSVFSPDGRRVASALAEGGAEVIDLATGEVEVNTPALWPVWGVDWSPDGRFLAMCGRANGATVLEVATGARTTLKSEASPVWTVRWITDREFMILPGGEVFSMQVPTQRLPSIAPDGERLDRLELRIRFVDGDRHLLCTGPDGRIELVDPLLETRREIARVPVERASTALTPDASAIVAADGVEPGPLWLVRPREGLTRRFDGEFLGPVAISPDARRVAAVGANGEAMVLDAETGRVEHRVERPMVAKTIAFVWIDPDTLLWCLPLGAAMLERGDDGDWSLSYEPDRSVIDAWPGRDGEWYWTDLGSRIVRSTPDRFGEDRARELVRGVGLVLGGALHPKLPLLALATADGRVVVFDESIKAAVSTFTMASRRVTDLAWSPDGSMLAAIDAGGAIRLFDGAPLARRWREIERRRAEADRAGDRPPLP